MEKVYVVVRSGNLFTTVLEEGALPEGGGDFIGEEDRRQVYLDVIHAEFTPLTPCWEFVHAYLLASAHGHWWTQAPLDKLLFGYQAKKWEGVGEVCDSLLEDGLMSDWRGVCPSPEHLIGTGRLFWRCSGETVYFEINRPGGVCIHATLERWGLFLRKGECDAEPRHVETLTPLLRALGAKESEMERLTSLSISCMFSYGRTGSMWCEAFLSTWRWYREAFGKSWSPRVECVGSGGGSTPTCRSTKSIMEEVAQAIFEEEEEVERRRKPSLTVKFGELIG